MSNWCSAFCGRVYVIIDMIVTNDAYFTNWCRMNALMNYSIGLNHGKPPAWCQTITYIILLKRPLKTNITGYDSKSGYFHSLKHITKYSYQNHHHIGLNKGEGLNVYLQRYNTSLLQRCQFLLQCWDIIEPLYRFYNGCRLFMKTEMPVNILKMYKCNKMLTR